MQNMILYLAQNSQEGRVFGLDQQTLISMLIQLLNGVILAVALGFILYKPLKEFMQKRTDRIQGKIDNAEATMAKAKELIAEYNEKLSQIDITSQEVIEEARLKAADESRVIIETAKQEAQEIRARTLESIEDDKRRLKEEARLYIIELAFLIAQKYVAQSIDDETQERLFEEAVAELEEAQWQN